MTISRMRDYFERHKSQLQVLWFLAFGLVALIAQLGSRIVCDIAFQGMSRTVEIWPFPSQTMGSFLAFLISNTLAKVISYITNRKKTFQANNNLCLSVVIYIASDERKSGGEYCTVTGVVKKLDEFHRTLIMMDGTWIPIEEIVELGGVMFQSTDDSFA